MAQAFLTRPHRRDSKDCGKKRNHPGCRRSLPMNLYHRRARALRHLKQGHKKTSTRASHWMQAVAQLPLLAVGAERAIDGGITPPLSIAAANGYVAQHRVAFLTSCMEEEFFTTYCTPLLSSFATAFGWRNMAAEDLETA